MVVLQTTPQDVPSGDGIEMAIQEHPVLCAAKGMDLSFFLFEICLRDIPVCSPSPLSGYDR